MELVGLDLNKKCPTINALAHARNSKRLASVCRKSPPQKKSFAAGFSQYPLGEV